MITNQKSSEGFSMGIAFKTVLVSFFLLVAFSPKGLFAQNSSKDYLVTVTTLDNKQVRGMLVSADEKGVSVIKRGGIRELVEPSKIKTIKLRPRKNAATGLLVGAGIGLVTGGALSLALKPDDSTEKVLAVVGTAGLTFIGAAIGGSAGSKSKHIFTIQGRSEDYNQSLKAIKAFIR